MFTEDRIARIFGNVEQLYKHQVSFLAALEKCIVWDKLSASQIGRCFLEYESDFRVYSDYCNNQPLAAAEISDLYQEPKYAHFFEACRLLRNMIDIDLAGFLLTPVQKICKYPLQLAELLKYTRQDHPDYQPVKAAQAAMQRVAELVNDRKRRIEGLEQLFILEKKIDNWEGKPLTETSSLLFYTGDLTRVTGAWSTTFTVFLFDHLLIYCKKDMMGKRYVYKGRIDMDQATFEPLEDGTRDKEFGFTCKNAFKIRARKSRDQSQDKEKCYLFTAKSAAEKAAWMRAFYDERRQTREDQSADGFHVTDKERRAAQLYLSNRSRPRPQKAKVVKRPSKVRRPDTAVAEIVLDPELGLGKHSRAGSLPSYLHPTNKMKLGHVGPCELQRQAPIKKKGSGWFHLGSSKSKSKKPVVELVKMPKNYTES